ncbi:cyclase family protein [Rhodocaloribacter litoris]|nr:cyclase family protein [Rhodocaloribacter litoris]QXD15413.1 cyclase family protein [Rhodocaloribacter litoris]
MSTLLRCPIRLVDLSLPISERIREPLPTRIEREDHRTGALNMARTLLGDVTPEAFPDGLALAGEVLMLTAHAGTHVDAPWHYHPTAGGRPARTIDQLPLDWFFHDGVVLDFSDRPEGTCLEPEDLEHKLDAIGYTLKPFDIVLLRCDADKRAYDPDYVRIHVGVSAEATRWLIDRGIRVMGTDGWGWDVPLHLQVEAYRRRPRPGVIWAAHFVGIEAEYCQIEKLANLDHLPPYGFMVACFPVKIERGSAGWARVVALVPEQATDLPATLSPPPAG